MQSSKTSKSTRKNVKETGVSAEPASAAEPKTVKRSVRNTETKKPSDSVAAAKSHRKAGTSKTAAAAAPAVKTLAAAAGTAAPATASVAVVEEFAVSQSPNHEEVAKRAYYYWLERGAKHGNAAEDWFRALQDLSTNK